MFSYFTQFKVSDRFGKEKLTDLFIDWLYQTRNKMEGLNYQQQNKFEYTIGKKTIKIQDFTEFHHFGIQFITTYNRSDAKFVVETILDYKNHVLHLYFKKEFTEQSKYVPGNSIPNIFKTLLALEESTVDRKPLFLSFKEYLQYKKHITKPVVILYRQQRCLLDPFLLNQDILGLGSVICIPTKKTPSIQIAYPDDSFEDIPFTHKSATISVIIDSLQQYLNHHLDICTFDDFIKLQLKEEHQLYEDIKESTASDLEREVELLKKEIQEIEEMNLILGKERLSLQNELFRLERIEKTYEKEALLVTSKFDEQDEKAVIMELIRKELQTLNHNNTSRRRDILVPTEKEQAND